MKKDLQKELKLNGKQVLTGSADAIQYLIDNIKKKEIDKPITSKSSVNNQSKDNEINVKPKYNNTSQLTDALLVEKDKRIADLSRQVDNLQTQLESQTEINSELLKTISNYLMEKVADKQVHQPKRTIFQRLLGK